MIERRTAAGEGFPARWSRSHGLRLFHEQSCKEGAHFWGDSMWDATLANTTQAYQTLVVGCCANGVCVCVP